MNLQTELCGCFWGIHGELGTRFHPVSGCLTVVFHFNLYFQKKGSKSGRLLRGVAPGFDPLTVWLWGGRPAPRP